MSEITGGNGARVVFDPVGGEYVSTLAQATAPEGTIYLYGMLSGQPTPYPMTGFAKGVAVTGYILTQMKRPDRLEAMKQYIFSRLADGRFSPNVDRVFRFAEIVDAYKYLESNVQAGKIVTAI